MCRRRAGAPVPLLSGPGTPARRAPQLLEVPTVHLSVPAPHTRRLHLRLPGLHVPALSLTGRLPIATVLLSVVYATAIAVALAAPGQHAVAGCAVLAGLVSRTVVRRRRTATDAVTASTVAVDTVLAPDATAPAPAVAA
jgi:hypothetical protein